METLYKKRSPTGILHFTDIFHDLLANIGKGNVKKWGSQQMSIYTPEVVIVQDDEQLCFIVRNLREEYTKARLEVIFD